MAQGIMRALLAYFTDLGLFFFCAHIAIFSMGGGVPLIGAITLFFFSLFIKIAQDFGFLQNILAIIPPALGRDALHKLFMRHNVPLFINGVFLLCLCALTLFDCIVNFDSTILVRNLLVAANGLGYGLANIRKSAELDGLWVLPHKETVSGNVIASLGRPEAISVYAAFPASILASIMGTWLILPLLIPALLISIKTGIAKFDDAYLNQAKRVVTARLLIAVSNLVVGCIGILDGKVPVGIGLFMFFVGNCIVAYRTYNVQVKA
jgi:hypothetical protein